MSAECRLEFCFVPLYTHRTFRDIHGLTYVIRLRLCNSHSVINKGQWISSSHWTQLYMIENLLSDALMKLAKWQKAERGSHMHIDVRGWEKRGNVYVWQGCAFRERGLSDGCTYICGVQYTLQMRMYVRQGHHANGPKDNSHGEPVK